MNFSAGKSRMSLVAAKATPAAWGAAFAGLLAESPGAELATERAAVPKETFDAADAAEEWLSVYRSLLRSAPSGRSRLTG